jgi:hypothetical protein
MHCDSLLLDYSDKGYQYGGLTYVSIFIVLSVGNTAITLVRGEGSFEDGSKAIMDAIKIYRDCREELTLPILLEIHEGTESFYSPDSSFTKRPIL